jgi:hypothetical protein
VQDVLDSRDCASARVGIGQVALNELDVRQVIEIPPLARAEVVQDADAMSELYERFSEMRSDEAGAACDQELIHELLLCNF